MPSLRAPVDTSDQLSHARRFMMFLVRFAVVALLVVAVIGAADKKTNFHCCSTIFSGLCPECFGCPYTAAPIDNMERLLKERIFGQEEALYAILTAFRAHNKKKPLTFHLAGDNGVGKSFTAKTIAESLYQYGNPSSGDFKGFLYLRGEQYQGIEQAEEYRQIITRRIVDQLVMCPNSLIVFDEVEYLAPQTVSAVSAFLDDSIPTFQYSDKIKCRTNEATFIVISDFGTEGKTDKMTFQEVKTLVERDSKEFWTNPKQPSKGDIVPFMSLNATARTQTALYQLSRLSSLDVFSGRNVRNITFAPGAAEAVAKLSNDAYSSQNGRGVTKYVESYVLPQIVSALDQFERTHARAQETQNLEKGTHRGVAIHVAAPSASQVHHKVKFDIQVEEVIWKDPKRSYWWSKQKAEEKTEL